MDKSSICFFEQTFVFYRSSSLITLERNIWYCSFIHWILHLSAPQVCLKDLYFWFDRCEWRFIAFICFLVVEITAFSDRYGDFEKIDTEILGVSTDSVVSLSALNDFIFSFFWEIFLNELISYLAFSCWDALLNKVLIKWNIIEHLRLDCKTSHQPGFFPVELLLLLMQIFIFCSFLTLHGFKLIGNLVDLVIWNIR